MIVGHGPIALAVGAVWGCLDAFTLLCLFFSLFPSLWETARYRLKYCLKWPLNPEQPPTNQHLERPKLYTILAFLRAMGLKILLSHMHQSVKLKVR